MLQHSVLSASARWRIKSHFAYFRHKKMNYYDIHSNVAKWKKNHPRILFTAIKICVILTCQWFYFGEISLTAQISSLFSFVRLEWLTFKKNRLFFNSFIGNPHFGLIHIKNWEHAPDMYNTKNIFSFSFFSCAVHVLRIHSVCTH